MAEIQVFLSDEEATAQLGQDISLAVHEGDCILLSGDLGAGKTTLARALIRQQVGDPSLTVPSPTYTLVQHYDAALPISHFDLYRLADPEELDELGLGEALGQGVAIIEWPQRAQSGLPKDAILIHLEEAADPNDPKGVPGRMASISGLDENLAAIRRSLAIREFLSANGYAGITRHRLTGDASTRSYESFHHDGEQLLIMNAPRQADGPIIRDGKPYSQIAHLAEDISAFVGVDELLRERGFNAPEILIRDLDQGLLVCRFLGDETLLDGARQPIRERYMAAIGMLAKLHQNEWPDIVTLAEGVTHTISPYDLEAMQIEVELLTDWYAPYQLGREPSQEERNAFSDIWRALHETVSATEQGLVLRDFHSPNILWLEQEAGHRQIGLIDFQDALIGPTAYDVASLAQDARVDVSADLEKALVDHYVHLRKTLSKSFNEADFRTAYAIMAAQRATKILGIFIRLSKRDGKHGYLQHLPRMKDYLDRSLIHPALASYRAWIDGFLQEDGNAHPKGGVTNVSQNNHRTTAN